MGPEVDITRFGLVKTNDDGRITDFEGEADGGDLQYDFLRNLRDKKAPANRTD